jgi:hypothetical protein
MNNVEKSSMSDFDSERGYDAGAANDSQARENEEPGYGGNPRDLDQEGDRSGYRRRRRRLSPEILALELEDGRLVGDVIEEFGAGVFAGTGLRLADGRLAESVVGPFGLGGFGGLGGLGTFGGFRPTGGDARAQFAVQQRMRKERLAALSRLGFGNSVLTGPRGVTANAPVGRESLESG